MGKKRLVINLEESHHRGLVDSARKADMTVANYVRKALGLPLERQGVKPMAETSVKKPTRKSGMP